VSTGTAEFRLALAKQVERAERNFRDGQSLVDALLEGHAKLNVIRIDLTYRRSAPATLAHAKDDLRNLFNNRRQNAIFRHWVGCIWRLEYTTRTGYHFHLILFFDGSYRLRDGVICQQIGQYWTRAITKGRGRFENCNFAKNRYKAVAIGMIKRTDFAKRYFLVHVALQYLAKVDEVVRPAAKKTFGTSQLPPPHSGLGRKRRDDGTDDALEAEGKLGGRLFKQLPAWAQRRLEWRLEHSRPRRGK
jgi:hypothetical protein